MELHVPLKVSLLGKCKPAFGLGALEWSLHSMNPQVVKKLVQVEMDGAAFVASLPVMHKTFEHPVEGLLALVVHHDEVQVLGRSGDRRLKSKQERLDHLPTHYIHLLVGLNLVSLDKILLKKRLD